MARLLAEAGAPVVRPANTLPPGPHYMDGVELTFWDFCSHDPAAEISASEAGRSLRVVHDLLNGMRTKLPALPVFTLQIDEAASLLRIRENVPLLPEEDRLFLCGLYETVRVDIGMASLDYQPLHGECHRVRRSSVLPGFVGSISKRRVWDRGNGTSPLWMRRVLPPMGRPINHCWLSQERLACFA